MYSGWEYDEDHKRELARPSSWGSDGLYSYDEGGANDHHSKSGQWGENSSQHAGRNTRGNASWSDYRSNSSQHIAGNARGNASWSDNRSNNAACKNYGRVSRPMELQRQIGTDRRTVGAISDRVGRMSMTSNLNPAGPDIAVEADHAVDAGVNFEAYENVPVEVKGENVPAPLHSFDDMQCHDVVQQNIKRCGYTQPTPVQKHAIPICMSRRDLMASAQTGSGKTAAFCLPIIACILRDRMNCASMTTPNASCAPVGLILSPTRELSSQIHAEAKKFAHQTSLGVAVVYGGAPVFAQISQLHEGVDILVATPGRLKDLIERRKVSLSQVRYLVLDEADRMLDMGFEPQISCIVEDSGMPSVGQRQTMLFSATFPSEIKELARKYLSDTNVFLSVGRVGSSTNLILQKVEYVDAFNKRSRLFELVEMHHMKTGKTGKQLTVVFAQTKREVDSLEQWLCRKGCHATSIHGDRTQYERERALKSFRAGNKPILIATDVAARGLDVPDVSQVVNYDLPQEIDSYVHRIGRTGRAGKIGTAVALFCENDIALAKPLVQLLKESKQEIPAWLLEYAAMERPSVYYRGRQRSSAKNW